MNKILLFLVLFISACTITANVVREPATDIKVYFCPHDHCQDIILSLIDSSEEIKCAFYELNLEPMIKKLKEKDAEVVIEDGNAIEGFYSGYSAALMHNKFCVFDSRIIMSGSMNPTERGNYYNNNNIIVIDSTALAENYLDEFEELKNNEFSKGAKVKNPVIYSGDTKIESYFCPEDNCKLKVINALKAANESIYFMDFSFTDKDIGNLLWNKDYLGADVKGVVEKRQAAGYSRYDDLKGFAILDKNPYTMHHKVFIIDNKTIITGSYNPTKNANERNDENILIIHDKKTAKKYIEEFERLYYGTNETSFLKITDVLYDAPGSDKGKEYVKIKNYGNYTIDLDYYFLSNNKTNTRLNGTISPGITITVFPKFSLTNKKGVVQLKKHIEVVDYFSWENI